MSDELAEKIKSITTYPWDVLDGKIITCNYIKLACKRFFRFLDDDRMWFDADVVEKIITFAAHFKHFVGKYNEKAFILEPWQKWIICCVYGFKWKKNNLRVTRSFILSMARKGGKSSLLSIMALWALFEENSASCVIAANSANQAKLLFNMASNYLKSIDKKGKLFRRYRDRILFDKKNSEIKVVASDASRLDGLNCSFFVEDETAAAPDSSIWDILESSQGSRTQPLACSCTTRGFQLSGFYHDLEQGAIEVLNGVKEDDTLFACIFTLDDDDDYKNPDVWIKAQPNLGVSCSREFIEQQVVKAKNNPVQELSIRTKVFNQWVSSSDSWIPLEHIYKSMEKVDINDYQDAFCHISFDLASVCDLTALCCMIPMDDKFIYKIWYFLPHDSIENNPNSERYKRWINQGYLIETPGNVTDYDLVLNEIVKIGNSTSITKISYDQWNATDIAIRLTELGMPLEPYSQSLASMNMPTKTLERFILGNQVIIDNNPITLWCFENAKTKFDYNDNVRIIKNSVMQKIDGVVAMIMAMGGYLKDEHYDNEIGGLTY